MSVVSNTCRGLLCGAALLAMSAPALAQNTTTADNVAVDDGFNNDADATTYDRTVTTTRTEDDDDFPWGLLGLLGLAGLLGRKRDAKDIHVDARRDTRP